MKEAVVLTGWQNPHLQLSHCKNKAQTNQTKDKEHSRDELNDVSGGGLAVVREQGVVAVQLVHLAEVRLPHAHDDDADRVAARLR